MNRYKICLMLILCFMFFGCASIQVENMVTNQNPSDSPNYPVNVSLDVKGGSPGVWAYSGTIAPEEFKKAVLMSLEKTAFFKKIVDPDNADYILSISLTYAGSHPGFTMHAWVNAEWTLYREKDNEAVWTAEVEGDGKATVGEALNGMTRQYMALERAAKSNIDQALTQMKDLSL